MAGLVSAGEPCSWLDVEIKCRFTRQVVVWGCPFKGQTRVSRSHFDKSLDLVASPVNTQQKMSESIAASSMRWVVA